MLVVGGGILLTGAALSVPYFYPTETLWYKVGLDKTLLQAGQIAGLLTLVLLVIQVLLALRPGFLVQSLGTGPLMRWHRYNGVFLAVLVMSHVLLVLVPEGLANLPLGWEYWPELVGATAVLLLLSTVLLSWFRARLHLNFSRWRLLHRPLGYGLLLLAALHVLFVSESFQAGLPRYGLLTVCLLVVVLAVGTYLRRHRSSS